MAENIVVDYDYARSLARDFSINNGCYIPPVDPFYIASLLSNCTVEVSDLKKEDAYIGYYKYTNVYKIFLNLNFSERRARFSLAHELGHILLDHFNKYDINNLTKEEIKLLDSEANSFANELLMPKIALDCISDKSIKFLSNVFNVSQDVVKIRLTYY